ncbi:IclR family transcriptional regulator [Streptomyces sp900116325]|uniref:IclR family transcriptional regulator n=1 Tax=Streptomyces sp. 900116325 TaxID=3154295 RepID=UPI0033A575D6
MSTLAKIGRLLDLFTAAAPEWGASEVAASLGIPRSTAHSLLTGLTEMGLLQVRRRGRYELGWRAFELGEVQRSSSALVPAARPVMEAYVRRLGETMCLGVFLRDCVLFIDKVVGDDPLSVIGPRLGARYEAHAFASGRLLLADRPPAATEQQLRARPLRVRTTRAPVDVDDLMRQLEDIRRTRVSFDHGETVQDVGCAATGIRGPHGEVIASLSISAPMRRFAQHEPQLVVAVRGAAVQVAERLRASEHPAGWRVQDAAAAPPA